jgi:dipeptidyl-peptidase-4
MKCKSGFLLLTSLLTFYLSSGQDIKTLSNADYQRAVSMLTQNVSKLVDNDIRPAWLPDGKLWYRSMTENSVEYKLFDPSDGKKETVASQKEIYGQTGSRPGPGRRFGSGILSPDGKYAAFIRDWNLWIRETDTGKEKALTTDGIENYGYATDNAGWKHSNRPVLSWSPDSKKIATFRQDQRHVSNMYLVRTKVGAPELVEWKYPLPGDKDIIRIYRIIIDLTKDQGITSLRMSSDARRGTLCDDISCEGGFDDVSWSDDSKQLVFVSTSRDHKQENVRIADCETGEVKDILKRKCPHSLNQADVV